MPTLQKLGAFQLTSPTVVIADPGYDEETARINGLGCFVSNCRTGDWRVELILDQTPQRRWDMPRTMTAICDPFPMPPEGTGWERVGEKIGGDGGVVGIYDFAHFHNDRLVPKGQRWTFGGRPANPADLWYSFNCEALQGKMAAVIPHGVAVNWDGGMDIDTFTSEDKIVAVRLSISGWPDHV